MRTSVSLLLSFLQALSWPQAGEQAVCTDVRVDALPDPPPTPPPLRPSAASTGGITGAAFLAADNEHGTEWTLESRLHTAEVGGNKQQKEDSDRHR